MEFKRTIQYGNIEFDITYEDEDYMKKLFDGEIISTKYYPFIFDEKDKTKLSYFRSQTFYNEVLDNNDLYYDLDDDNKIIFGIGLRDMFIANNEKKLNKTKQKILMELTNIIDNKNHIMIENYQITPYPTRTNKICRFFNIFENNKYFAIFDNFVLGFMNPYDLSYHNFENILSLDYIFDSIKKLEEINEDFKILCCSGDDIFRTKINLTDDIFKIDKLNLYQPPFNSESRGGKRMIFSSKKLSKVLTKILKQDLSFYDFEFVNEVFRYNKFLPCDKRFEKHYDTPYYDQKKSHYSKYTLIIYLNHPNEKVLNVNGNDIFLDDDVNCIIFNQKYEHEGFCFKDSDKIFIRTELISKLDKNFSPSHNTKLVELFNKACYFDKKSLFNPELKKYSSMLFNLSTKLRFDDDKTKIKYYDKYNIVNHTKYNCDKLISFITNGVDFYFSNKIPLTICSIVILIENYGYDNLKNNTKTFESDKYFIFDDEEDYEQSIDKIINDYFSNDENCINNLFTNEYHEKFIETNKYDYIYHCPLDCQYADYKTENEYYRDKYDKYTKSSDNYTIKIFDDIIRINEKHIKITEDEIIVSCDDKLNSFNFASCQCDIGCDYTEVDVGKFRFRPMKYITTDKYHHIKVNIFNNNFNHIEYEKNRICKEFDSKLKHEYN